MTDKKDAVDKGMDYHNGYHEGFAAGKLAERERILKDLEVVEDENILFEQTKMLITRLKSQLSEVEK